MGQPAKVAAFSDRHGYDREHRLTATISSDFRVNTPSGSAGMSWRSRTRAIPAASGPRYIHSSSISTASECHPDHLGAGEHRVHAMVARVSLLTEALGGLAAPNLDGRRVRVRWYSPNERTPSRGSVPPVGSTRHRPHKSPSGPGYSTSPWLLGDSSIDRFTWCRWHGEAPLSTQAYRSNLGCNGSGLVVSVRQGPTGSSGGYNF